MTIKTDKLADNFYTLTGMNGAGRTGGAIGILTGPDGVFMVDATFAPLTEKVLAAIRQVAPDQPVRFVVNSHAHPDHTGGDANLAKMGATIIARPELRAALAANRNFPVEGLPRLTYRGRMTLHMNGEEIEVIALPTAHTDGDTMVYFRKANVLMIGDFFRKGYPNVANADGMIEALGMAAAVCGPASGHHRAARHTGRGPGPRGGDGQTGEDGRGSARRTSDGALRRNGAKGHRPLLR
jgi:glyoxylase-like metal-dependent hydrolase (beta-lactamase superfamily II)